jgi:hypothetical protein
MTKRKKSRKKPYIHNNVCLHDEERTAEGVLRQFVRNIEVTGGVVLIRGRPYPLGEQEWADLADTYMKACEVLGVEPIVNEGSGEEADLS